MAQTPLFVNVAELSALNVFTFLSSRFTKLSVPFKVIVPKASQLTCYSFTGDLYDIEFIRLLGIQHQVDAHVWSQIREHLLSVVPSNEMIEIR